MRKVFLFIVVLLVFTSCSDKHIFSEFDQVEYYKLIVENDSIDEKKDSITSDITYIDYPKTINDSDFFKELTKPFYKKNDFSREDVTLFNDYLKESSSLLKSSSACIPIYRDIFILKKEGKTIGIAKICFECDKFCFIGNKKNNNSIEFDNYEFLKKLLIKYKKVK